MSLEDTILNFNKIMEKATGFRPKYLFILCPTEKQKELLKSEGYAYDGDCMWKLIDKFGSKE